MRRLTAWIGGTLGGITAYRLLRRRPQTAAEAPPAPAPPADDRAEELRAKLAESRVAEPPAQPIAEEPPPGPEVEDEPESPDARRRRVHEEGRAALDEMQPD
jgi:hypothetical protein